MWAVSTNPGLCSLLAEAFTGRRLSDGRWMLRLEVGTSRGLGAQRLRSAAAVSDLGRRRSTGVAPGRRLFFVDPQGRLRAVAVSPGKGEPDGRRTVGSRFRHPLDNRAQCVSPITVACTSWITREPARNIGRLGAPLSERHRRRPRRAIDGAGPTRRRPPRAAPVCVEVLARSVRAGWGLPPATSAWAGRSRSGSDCGDAIRPRPAPQLNRKQAAGASTTPPRRLRHWSARGQPVVCSSS